MHLWLYYIISSLRLQLLVEVFKPVLTLLRSGLSPYPLITLAVLLVTSNAAFFRVWRFTRPSMLLATPPPTYYI